ncbi:MAG: histidinol dehydrogenase [candidate division NC10 bacterium CSP1-5]|nr:MAG: histidinol dehydrogenase [candidate division NC10 bacterium CSP1-5]
MIRILRADGDEGTAFLKELAVRRAAVSAEAEEVVRPILTEVREKGDAALLEYARRFDGASLTPGTLRVTPDEVKQAVDHLQPEAIEALRLAAARIEHFHRRQLPHSWFVTEEGAVLGQLCRPLDAVGIYIPGGKAVYPSTVLMNGVPAAVAGVERRVICTPVSAGLAVHPAVLVAASLAGIAEIYKVGGAQAIAALAYGTDSIPRVDKIVGPGNMYVATAKRLVAGVVGIDGIAGPTEVVVVADETGDPAYIGADLLAQAEHDEMAMTVCITVSEALAAAVVIELKRQLTDLPRRRIAEASLAHNGAVLVVPTLDAAFALVNRIAPEHVELHCQNPWSHLERIRHAGAVCIGAFSPEALGDYLAGPNHVLPTGGTARFASPLSVEDFLHRTSLLHFTEEGLKRLGGPAMTLASLEGLDGHARAVRIRQR